MNHAAHFEYRGRYLSGLALTVMVSGNVYAIEEVGWRDAQGNPIPEADHIRSSKGFGGSVLITPDADWKENGCGPSRRSSPPRTT